MKICKICEIDFDENSIEKRRAGGLIVHCPECSDETNTKYLGLQSGDGKSAGVTILSFSSNEDRESYREMWRINSGMTVGKSCQMMIQRSTPNVKFKKVYEAGLGLNHKGKL
jgi:hypothetical protein